MRYFIGCEEPLESWKVADISVNVLRGVTGAYPVFGDTRRGESSVHLPGDHAGALQRLG